MSFAEVSTRGFRWEGQEASAFASDVGLERFEYINGRPGITLVSHTTGTKVRFVVYHVEQDAERDIRYWTLKPASTSHPHQYTLTIYND